MHLDIRLVSALEKVFIDQAPEAYPQDIPMTGLRNETQSFQIAYCPLPPCSDDRPMLYYNASLSVPFRIRKVEQVAVRFPCFIDTDGNYLRKMPGLYPDVLQEALEGQPIRGYLGQWSALWVDIEPDENAQPGDYNFYISFSDEAGNPAGGINVPFTILATALPPQDLIHARWLHCDALSDYYGVEMFSDEHFDILDKFITLAVKRGINMMLVPIHTPPLDTREGHERLTAQLVDVYIENGQYRFGFDKLERFVALCQRAGVVYYEMAHLFTQWGAMHTPKIIAQKDGGYVRLFGWETDATGPEYAGFLAAYLPALTGELRRLGIADKCYFHISDEPNKAQIDSYQKAKILAAPYLTEFPIIDALSDFSFYENGAVEHPIPAIDHLEPFLAAEIPQLWTYYCVGQHRDVTNTFIAMPSSRTRILGLQLYQYKLKGFLQWAYNFYYS